MIYILGTNLKNTQKVWRSLCKVHGINGVLSGQICNDLGISRQVRINQLLPSQIDSLNQIVPQHYLTGAELETEVRKNQERLITISTYRGIRHSQGLPTRGQRTHGNAQTSRTRVLRRSRPLQQKDTHSRRKKR